MDTIELMKLASDSKPEVMEKIASNLKLIEALAPEFVPDVVAELNDVVSTTSEKVASLKAMGKILGGAALGALGTAITVDLFDAAKRGLTSSTNYRRILEFNPDLKRDVDTKRLKSSFDVIHRYAPEFTSDPIMGGSILRAVAELPGQEMAVIKDLIKSRKELLEAKSKQFDVGNAAKGFGQAWDEEDKGEVAKHNYSL